MNGRSEEPAFRTAIWRTITLLLAVDGVVLTLDKSATTIQWLAVANLCLVAVVSAWFHGHASARRR